MKLTIQEYLQGTTWRVSGEMGDGDATQYFHAESESLAEAKAEVISQAKSFKTYEVEI